MMYAHSLAPGTMVDSYRIERVLSLNAQGITYLATDLKLSLAVAIREFMPLSLATRGARGLIIPLAEEEVGEYTHAVHEFCKHAQTFGRVRHHNLIRIVRLLEAHGSAYLVNEYERGQALPLWVATHGLPKPQQLCQWLGSLAEALATMHEAKLIHQGVQPARLMVRPDLSIVLLDAGMITPPSRKPFVSSANAITPGFSAFEQYWQGGPIGPGSDLYSLAAVGYWLITGIVLPEAPARASGVHYPELNAHPLAKPHAPEVVKAITEGIALHHKDRQINLNAWRQSLINGSEVTANYHYHQAPSPSFAPTLKPHPAGVTFKPNAQILSAAEHILARQLGAMARIVIKRAAQEATSLNEFIDTLSAELDLPNEREAFKLKLRSLA